jgi:hypothetical protein
MNGRGQDFWNMKKKFPNTRNNFFTDPGSVKEDLERNLRRMQKSIGLDDPEPWVSFRGSTDKF